LSGWGGRRWSASSGDPPGWSRRLALGWWSSLVWDSWSTWRRPRQFPE